MCDNNQIVKKAGLLTKGFIHGFCGLLCMSCLTAQAAMLNLQIGNVSGPMVNASQVSLQLSGDDLLEISAERLQVKQKVFSKVNLICVPAAITPAGVIECSKGTLSDATLHIPIRFKLDAGKKLLELELSAENDERWQLRASQQANAWQATLDIANGQIKRMPADIGLPVAISNGLLNGHATLNGDKDGVKNIEVSSQIDALTFADAAGLHAGEKVAGKLALSATAGPSTWRWQASVDWTGGEVFWQPFYFANGGHTLQAGGRLDDQSISVESASLALKNVGPISFKGNMRLADMQIQQLDLSAPDLDLAQLYPLLLKPYLEKTALNNLEMAGQAGFNLHIEQGQPQNFKLDLRGMDLEDKNGRFALYKVNATLPWDYDAATAINLRYSGGNLLHLPLGAANLDAELNRYALTARQFKLPVLDGSLALADVSAAWVGGQWHWHLRANLAPVSMNDLSHALSLPHMEGKVSAAIPLVTYSGGQLSTDGAMQFNIFDGTATITNLTMQNPLGIAPKLTGNMQLRNLDLGVLTRTFSFGAIEGKLDGDVNNLQLANWQPVNFDADVRSSPGSYPKKISQRAVENISALGGAGAAAAIQRSFLRFFKEFNYEKLGLSCRLRGDICKMDGIESTPQGYVIVKGSGIPSITVLGYNHSVSWGELLGRIKRVTQGNAKPIIK